VLKDEGAGQEDIISAIYSFPQWIIKYWARYFGMKKTIRICSSLNRVPVFYIRSDMRRYQEKRGESPESGGDCSKAIMGLEKVEASPVELYISGITKLEPEIASVLGPLTSGTAQEDGLVFGEAARISSAMGLERESLYRDGIITVQDLSSQMGVKYFLAPGKDEKILDCCAAPGGKASFAASIMEDSGRIVAVDKSSGKIKLLEKNLDRLGIKNTDTFLSDSSQPGFLDGLEGGFKGYFDRIMVDAPCTALGTAAKNPEVKYNRDIPDVKRLSGLSSKILAACHPYLRPGGRIMFYTCTISPEENGKAVRDFINKMKGIYSITQKDGIDLELDIMPYYLNSEGGYSCVLEKKR
jgi:16S rRNA (cytosine967-C5)-methyltransferase